MSVSRRRLGAALQQRADRLNALLARTITRHRLVAAPMVSVRGGPERMRLDFRVYSALTPVPLPTRFGQMGLYIGQFCEAGQAAESGPTLVTVGYRYALYRGGDDEPTLRWEYDGTTSGALWCRRHLQGPVRLPFTEQGVALDDLHLPTGEVLIEDVIRFCIVDLGVEPLSVSWSALLSEGRESVS